MAGGAGLHSDRKDRAAMKLGMSQVPVEIPGTAAAEEHSMLLEQVSARACKTQGINDSVTLLYLEINTPELIQGTNKRISPSPFQALFPSQDWTSLKIRRL